MSSPLDNYLATVPADKTSLTDDERIENIIPLPPPEHLIRFFPIQGTAVEAQVTETRRQVRQILQGRSDRLLVVMGPCSIHDPAAALAYAEKLSVERKRHAGELELLMRVYFEKPRTTVGWKGLINDPYLNGSFRINEGLRIARDLLVRINQLGVPAGCEFLDVLSRAGLPERLMIDCSHANAGKQYQRQLDVAKDIGAQLARGERRIIGVMVESHLVAGRQDLESGRALRFGQSITDGCLGWDDSRAVLEALAEALKRRRAGVPA